MINDLRKILQSRLEQIENLNCGTPKTDDLVEENEIFYGYELTYSVNSSDLGYQYNDYSITLTGRLVSKNKSLAIMDHTAQEIAQVLRDLRFKYTIQDVTEYSTTKKLIINGTNSMDEVNYNLR